MKNNFALLIVLSLFSLSAWAEEDMPQLRGQCAAALSSKKELSDYLPSLLTNKTFKAGPAQLKMAILEKGFPKARVDARALYYEFERLRTDSVESAVEHFDDRSAVSKIFYDFLKRGTTAHGIRGIFRITSQGEELFYLLLVKQDLGDGASAYHLIKYDANGIALEYVREPYLNENKFELNNGDPNRWYLGEISSSPVAKKSESDYMPKILTSFGGVWSGISKYISYSASAKLSGEYVESRAKEVSEGYLWEIYEDVKSKRGLRPSHRLQEVYEVAMAGGERFYLAKVEEYARNGMSVKAINHLIKYDTKGHFLEHVRDPYPEETKFELSSSDPNRWVRP